MTRSYAPMLPPPPSLTERQWQVLRLIQRGLTYEQIGHELGIDVRTVENHVAKTYAVLGVNNQMDALRVSGLSVSTARARQRPRPKASKRAERAAMLSLDLVP